MKAAGMSDPITEYRSVSDVPIRLCSGPDCRSASRDVSSQATFSDARMRTKPESGFCRVEGVERTA